MFRRLALALVLLCIVGGVSLSGSRSTRVSAALPGQPSTVGKGCPSGATVLWAKKPGVRDEVQVTCFDTPSQARAGVASIQSFTAGELNEYSNWGGPNGARYLLLQDFDCSRGDDPSAEGIGWTNLYGLPGGYSFDDITTSVKVYCASMTLYQDPNKTGASQAYFSYNNSRTYPLDNGWVGSLLDNQATSLKFGN